ncbi:MAG: zinc-binding dehydrogenase [Spirochaetales bacterium]|nr:zinc-binding dehydrogenase [Spirochaetales bacterium]
MFSIAVDVPGKVAIVEIPRPEPGPYEAVVRNAVAMICNATDRKLVGGHFPGIGPEQYPLLLGHESAGVVESVGDKVRSFEPGDHVIGGLLLKPTDPRYSSGWGGFSEFVVATDHAAMAADGVADQAHGWVDVFQIMKKVPADIPLESACLLCTWREVYAGFSDFQLKPGDDILVFGAGPVGLSFCRFARLLGLGWVGVVDPLPLKRERAEALGADATFAPDSRELQDLTARRGKPLDAVVDAVGREEIINAGLPLIRMAGSICVYGVVSASTLTISKDSGPYNFTLFMHQWPTRIAEAAAQEPLVEWIREGKLSHENFITAEFPLRQIDRALEATTGPGALKTLLRF